MKKEELVLEIKKLRAKVKELEKLEKGGQLPDMSYCMRSKRALKHYRGRLEFLEEYKKTEDTED